MICKSCGTENQEGAVCCASCGASLAEEAKVAEPRVPVEEEPKKPSKVMGILSAVLGGVSLLGNGCTCFCGCLGGLPAIVMGIVGIVLAIVGMSNAKKAGTKDTLAIVGLVLSILSLVVFTVVCIVNGIIGGASGFLAEMMGSQY